MDRATLCLHSIARDGFTIEDGQLRRTLPEVLELPAADDEVHLLLNRYGLRTSLGHLEQAITAHTQGNWASANSQLRTFFESLFDEIAPLIDPQNGPTARTGETRRQLLANFTPPFISRDLNEWSDDGKNFVNGTFKRLHPQGHIRDCLTKKIALFDYTLCCWREDYSCVV